MIDGATTNPERRTTSEEPSDFSPNVPLVPASAYAKMGIEHGACGQDCVVVPLAQVERTMSKTLSTEMSVDQIRRHINERNRQMPVERSEIEEAEAMLQAKLLEQTNVRLDQLNLNLEQFRGEMGQMVHALQEGLGAYQGLQRSIRRYSRATSLLTLLLILATAILVRIGYVQMEGVDHAFLWTKAPTRAAASVALPTTSQPAPTPQAEIAKAPASVQAPTKPQDDSSSWLRNGIVSPYHLPPGNPKALEPWPAPVPAAAVTQPAPSPVATISPVAPIVAAPTAPVEKSPVATLGPKAYGPLLPSGLMSPFPPVLNNPQSMRPAAGAQQPSASTSSTTTPTSPQASAGSWRPET